MASPTKINFKIYQGSTFKEVLRWESTSKKYEYISSIPKAAPMVVNTIATHSIPVGWRVKITDVVGMKEINSTELYRTVTAVTPTSLEFSDINNLSYSAYTSGGIVEYNQPVDLAGYTARMQIRAKLQDTVVLHELTTENGGITINNTNKTITLSIPATDTTLFDFSTAVYSLEMINLQEVIPFINGSITVDKEITR